MAVYAVQLVSLPPQLWKNLSGRDLMVRGYELLDIALPWRPLSFSQDATVASALALLPGLCSLSLVLRMPRERFHIVGYAIIGVSITSIIFGIAQLSGGAGSPSYWHNQPGGDSAHGFFANPNHLSTLLLVTLPVMAAVAKTASGSVTHRKRLWTGLGAAGLFVIFGILISESTGGLVLLVPTLVASGVLLMKSRPELRLSKGRGAAMVVGVVLALCLPVAIVLSGNHELNPGSSLGFGEFERLGISTTAIGAMVHYWPYGSGMGTFPLVYPIHENPLSVTNVFINHAHNEYIELLFESGILGAGLILSVLAWWTWRSFLAWRRSDNDAAWEQAASIAIAVIAIHSSFDYPARTPAILALGAAFCAILGRSIARRNSFSTVQGQSTGLRSDTV